MIIKGELHYVINILVKALFHSTCVKFISIATIQRAFILDISTSVLQISKMSYDFFKYKTTVHRWCTRLYGEEGVHIVHG